MVHGTQQKVQYIAHSAQSSTQHTVQYIAHSAQSSTKYTVHNPTHSATRQLRAAAPSPLLPQLRRALPWGGAPSTPSGKIPVTASQHSTGVCGVRVQVQVPVQVRVC